MPTAASCRGRSREILDFDFGFWTPAGVERFYHEGTKVSRRTRRKDLFGEFPSWSLCRRGSNAFCRTTTAQRARRKKDEQLATRNADLCVLRVLPLASKIENPKSKIRQEQTRNTGVSASHQVRPYIWSASDLPAKPLSKACR